MTEKKKKKDSKFGTFKGVFIPSTEAILGTVLFLLLPALAIDMGFLPIAVIIILAHTITVATSFSLSDCATNLHTIGGGGMYALSRKSLGKAFGGSIGIMLFLAQAASIGFYCIGFAEPLQPFINEWVFTPLGFLSTNGLTGDVLKSGIQLQSQIIAGVIFLVFFIIVMVGADFTLKIQLGILFILIGSVAVIFVAPFLPVPEGEQGLFVDSVKDMNFWGHRSVKETITIGIFFLSFTQFFPAVTGIDAGVGMSGELREPKKSLVRGTFTAIAVTFVVYMIAVFIFSLMKTELVSLEYEYGKGLANLGIPKTKNLTVLMGIMKNFPFNLPGIMILLGILFATSSSALSCFMTAPRTAQSLCKDNIMPRYLSFMAKDFKAGGKEPRYATLISFVIAFSVIVVGNINTAAVIVGICFLVVYGWVNVSAFLERISKNPTFRPTIKNHWLVSLYGFLAALIAICLFDWRIGIFIIVTQMLLFWLILKYKSENKLEGVWWGVVFSFVSTSLKSLQKIVQGTKNWRPLLTAIAFAGEKKAPGKIAYIASRIADHQGLVNLDIIYTKDEDVPDISGDEYKIPTTLINVSELEKTFSMLSIIQAGHLGGFVSNSVLFEFNSSVNNVQVIKKILSLKKNVFVLKNGERLESHDQIDIWWRGEKNGNLMVLLAYIINNARSSKGKNRIIRIVRKLGVHEQETSAKAQMEKLLEKSRLSGEVVILPHDDEPFVDTLQIVSRKADLIMMGLPGRIESDEKGIAKFFNLSDVFFKQEITKYDKLAPILFVKSAQLMNLIEE